jgi:hypothetical protein
MGVLEPDLGTCLATARYALGRYVRQRGWDGRPGAGFRPELRHVFGTATRRPPDGTGHSRTQQRSAPDLIRTGQGPIWLVWRVKDSNLGRHQPTDLQSAPIGRSGNPPGGPGAPAAGHDTQPATRPVGPGLASKVCTGGAGGGYGGGSVVRCGQQG